MKHFELLQQLKDVGLNVQVHAFPGQSSSLYINGSIVSKDNYNLFGYECLGTYNTCGRTDKVTYSQLDLKHAIKAGVDTIMTEQALIFNRLNFDDIRSFLNLQERTGKSKVDKESCKRVKNLILDNFQELTRNKQKFTGKP